MQTGTVIGINHRLGRFLIEGDDGEFSAWQLDCSFELELGSRVCGELDALGGETLQHLGSGEAFDAVGETGPSSRAPAVR